AQPERRQRAGLDLERRPDRVEEDLRHDLVAVRGRMQIVDADQRQVVLHPVVHVDQYRTAPGCERPDVVVEAGDECRYRIPMTHAARSLRRYGSETYSHTLTL